jgi:hypothetical protein
MFSTFSTISSVITTKVGSLIGTNWSIKLNGVTITTSGNQNGTVIEADITGQHILAINQGSKLVYTSNDYGTNWVSRTSTHGLPSGTDSAPSGCGVSGTGQYMYVAMAVGTIGTIFKSSNYGASWSSLSGIPGLAYYSLSVSSDGQSVLCTQCSAGTTALYLSTNGGTTFNNIASNTSPGGAGFWGSYSISPDGTKIVACGWNGGKIVYSDNGGTSWTIIDSGSPSAQWGQIVVSNTGKCVVTIISSSRTNSVYVWNGTTWTGITGDMIPKDRIRICAASDDLSVILVSQRPASDNGYLYLSTDGGTTFKQLTAFGSSNYQAVGVSGDGKYIYCAGNATNSKLALYSSFN